MLCQLWRVIKKTCIMLCRLAVHALLSYDLNIDVVVEKHKNILYFVEYLHILFS